MRKTLCAALVTLAFLVSDAHASPVLTFNEATGTAGTNQDQSVGWQFNVLSPTLVTVSADSMKGRTDLGANIRLVFGIRRGHSWRQ